MNLYSLMFFLRIFPIFSYFFVKFLWDISKEWLKTFCISDRLKDSAGHYDSSELPGMMEESGYPLPIWNALMLFYGASLLLSRCISRRLLKDSFSFFRFRFLYVLRVQENLQVANGVESTRTRRMRQDLVYLSILSQHHADEIQSIESFEKGTWLLRFNHPGKIVEQAILLLILQSS